eukprot:1858969-Rhodomonas_salina.1
MTLVVKGSASYFDNGVAGGYSLELEDLITIYIMETGVSTYESVKGMLAEQRAFTLLVALRPLATPTRFCYSLVTPA